MASATRRIRGAGGVDRREGDDEVPGAIFHEAAATVAMDPWSARSAVAAAATMVGRLQFST